MASLPSWEMSRLCALEVREGVLAPVRYFVDTVISSLDEIILVLFSGCLLSDATANMDPN